MVYEKNGKIDNIRIIKITEVIKNSFIKTGKILLFNEKTLTKPIHKVLKNKEVDKIEGFIPKGVEIIRPWIAPKTLKTIGYFVSIETSFILSWLTYTEAILVISPNIIKEGLAKNPKNLNLKKTIIKTIVPKNKKKLIKTFFEIFKS